MLFYVIAILVVIADQAAKWGVRSNMQLGETIQVWSGHLQFTYYENSGAAFSSFQGYGKYFAIIAVLFVAGVFYYRRKGELRGPILEAATGFLVGGAVGNAIDRVLYHQVTDFLVFGSRGGILNLADLAINAGGLLVLVHLLKEPLKRVMVKR
ncbi:signal peptidase II [Paenibacillus jilunlii]|uniref:Lipoprotein signal peptidase n=1 Tax=Paenibacillus jilunlii TaxID=682956 RepID=A0A1G9Y6H2_9BACL|nr:signal peptidase II [Paenibacillus jilunlii]KWX77576.1 signal peptidase II [Paenibacillus jilunlii]SDN04657.1 signal peptidase II Aspartic peptidase. MEROPS family A08 [Paenibacillus jilunlii]